MNQEACHVFLLRCIERGSSALVDQRDPQYLAEDRCVLTALQMIVRRRSTRSLRNGAAGPESPAARLDIIGP
jgi:hypothetical protein